MLPDDTVVEANKTYRWRFTPANGSYTTLTGAVELYHRSSSGSGNPQTGVSVNTPDLP